MPVATVSTEAQRYDLKTLAGEGDDQGYIMARPLPYGMVLERRDRGTKMSMEQEIQRGRKKKSIGQNEPETQKIELETLSAWMANHDFAYCIVDHNLTDKKGAKLDFSNPMAIKALDPRIGREIENILNELNEPEEDEETIEDFTASPTSSSQVRQEPLIVPTPTPA